MSEPTPRPWTSIGPGEYGDRAIIARYPPQVHIAMTDDHASAAADVHLIVEAVNAYDRLRAIEAAARTFFEDEHECLHDDDPPCGLADLRAALETPA